jgi:hypothetical protein
MEFEEYLKIVSGPFELMDGVKSQLNIISVTEVL